MSALTLSVIMPCFNEELAVRLSIERTFKAFKKYHLDGEIIVIDDGSIDETSNIVRSLQQKYSNLVLLRNDTNQGIGYSFFKGVANSSKELITMFPGDNESNPIDSLLYIHLMNSVDILVPFIRNVEVRSVYRRLISSCFRFIVNLSFGMNLNYTNGTVIYRRCILSQIKPISKGFFYQAEILVQLIRTGYLYAETPHFLEVRTGGVTKAVSLKSLKNVLFSFLTLFYKVHIQRSLGNTDIGLHPESITYFRINNV